MDRVIIEATIKKTEYKLDSRQLAILTCLAGLAGSFPPSTMNVYVCPLSTVISGMSKSLMYHAIPQAGCPIYLIIKIFDQLYKSTQTGKDKRRRKTFTRLRQEESYL